MAAAYARRTRSILVSVALALALIGIAAWTFRHGAEDWRYQLAGLADPFLGRPAPGTTVVVGLVISGLLGAVARIARRVVRSTRPSSTSAAGPRRWRWWWPLIAAWGGFVAGGAFVLAGSGPIDYHGTVHVEFGAPIRSDASTPATCRSVVGHPLALGQVDPTVERFMTIGLRDVATGRPFDPMPFILPTQADDGRRENDFDPPGIPVRPAPYITMTREDGSTWVQPPITFVQAYDYEIVRFEESGLSGVVVLRGTRFKDPFGSSDARWVNLVLADDPWPETYELTIAWTCEAS